MPDQRVEASNSATSRNSPHPASQQSSIRPLVYAQTLGSFRLLVAHPQGRWVDITPHLPRGHGRARELLALLLTHRRALTREEAAKMLWPNEEPRDRARRLRNALYHARQALVMLYSLVSQTLGIAATDLPQLTLQDTTARLSLLVNAPRRSAPDDVTGDTPISLSLPPTLVEAGFDAMGSTSNGSPTPVAELLDPGLKLGNGLVCDTPIFELLTQRLRAAQTAVEQLRWGQGALAFYAGPFMPGHDSAWIAARREHLETRWAQLCLDLAAFWRLTGDHVHAIGVLLQVLERQPDHEDAARAAMHLLASRGATVEALRIYERVQRVYREHHKRESGALRRLANEIRAGHIMAEPGEGLLNSSGGRWAQEPPKRANEPY